MIVTPCATGSSEGKQPALTLPKITVVTPSLNQGKYLERAIQSVISQQYPNVEYCILDAGSTDMSPEIIRKYEPELTYWTSAPDAGQSDAIVQGWKRANGDILAWLNSDDFYYPETLHQVGEFFSAHPDVMMLCGTVAMVDESERLIRYKSPPEVSAESLLPWGNVPCQPGTFIRRQVFERLGGPRMDLHYVMDWELWLRIALHFPPSAIALTGAILAADRNWSGTKTSNARGQDAVEVRRVLSELFACDALPPELRRLRRRAFARAWWRQSKGELKADLRGPALVSLLQAIWACPLTNSPLKCLRHARRILLGPKSSAKKHELPAA